VGYEIQLLGVTQLAGLVEQYGPEKVYRATLDALGFHPGLVTSMTEATAVAEYLAKTNAEDCS
jgi:hypothetical protein